MCNIAEYIVMRRAAHIINSIINKPENASKASYFSLVSKDMGNILDSKPYVGPDSSAESCVKFQRRLEDIFTLVFEGCKISRFVAIDKTADEIKTCNTIPMYLVEIFEPSHCYMPVYVVDDAVLAISPFNNTVMSKVSKNPYIIELFPTSYAIEAMNAENPLQMLNDLLGQNMPFNENTESVDITRRHLIEDCALLFNQGITRQDNLLTKGFADMGSEKIVEVSSESIYFKKMKAVYGMESVESAEELGDGVIDPTDFMPIYLTTKGTSGFAILADKDKGEKTVTTISIKPQVLGLTVNDKEIKAVLTKENTSANRYFMIELDEYYYIGSNKAVAFLDGEISNPINLLEEYAANLDSPVPMDEISNEGITDKIKGAGEVAKSVMFVLKKFGLKHGSNVGATLTQLFKSLGVKNVKWAMNQFASTFKRGLDLEKEDALELQEKLLNDEIDALEERVNSYAKTWFRSVSLTIFCGGMLFFPLAWLISRSRTKNARIRAIERLELRFDNIIERIERKINYAEERSENETVDQLIRERQAYQAARMRLLKMKDDTYGKKPIKYATFDKNLTMTASQRLDAYLTNGNKNNDY